MGAGVAGAAGLRGDQLRGGAAEVDPLLRLVDPEAVHDRAGDAPALHVQDCGGWTAWPDMSADHRPALIGRVHEVIEGADAFPGAWGFIHAIPLPG